MNKYKAKKAAYENTLTWGELYDLIKDCPRDGMSSVSKTLTKEESLVVLEKFVKEKDPSEVPETSTYNGYRSTLSKDGLCVVNILRECA